MEHHLPSLNQALWLIQGNVPYRKCPRRRHRLDFVRNCLNDKSAEMEDVEFWMYSHTIPVQVTYLLLRVSREPFRETG